MTTTVPPVTTPALRTALLDAMTRLGVRSEPGYYLDWDHDDTLPPWVPPDREDIYIYEYWCWDCIKALCVHLDQFQATWEYWNGVLLDAEGEPYWKDDHYGIGNYDSGEGPYWCHACGVSLTCGFTYCSVDDVLRTWEGQPLGPAMLPELVEALDYVGEGLPHT